MGQFIKDLEALDSDPVGEVSKIIKEGPESMGGVR